MIVQISLAPGQEQTSYTSEGFANDFYSEKNVKATRELNIKNYTQQAVKKTLKN
jgi:hypothetical protein